MIDLMKHIATALLFDRNNKLLIYLRDDKPTIPFPNHWDLFGGYVEDGETPEQALVRETKEELDLELKNFEKFRDYDVKEGDAHPNVKHVYWARVDVVPEELTLNEGQRLVSIDLEDRHKFKFANVLGKIIDDFVQAEIFGKENKNRWNKDNNTND